MGQIEMETRSKRSKTRAANGMEREAVFNWQDLPRELWEMIVEHLSRREELTMVTLTKTMREKFGGKAGTWKIWQKINELEQREKIAAADLKMKKKRERKIKRKGWEVGYKDRLQQAARQSMSNMHWIDTGSVAEAFRVLEDDVWDKLSEPEFWVMKGSEWYE